MHLFIFLQKEKIRRELEDCTFKPSINHPKRSTSAPKPRPSKHKVHERLEEYAKKAEERRELRKKAMEKQEQQVAPLKPNIPAYKKVNKGMKRASSGVFDAKDSFERLYKVHIKYSHM